MMVQDDKSLSDILESANTIAVVGASPDMSRDSNRIMAYLLKVGYEVIPVNPNYAEVMEKKCFPTVTSIGRPIDIVDVFRRSIFINEVAKDTVEANAGVLWMQLGVINEDAAGYAESNGVKVVMDRCIMVEYRRLVNRNRPHQKRDADLKR